MNRYHRWYCRSDRWARALRGTVVPWVLRDYDLGDTVLEIGPGPGLVTEILRERVGNLTSLEIDQGLAASLKTRLDGTNVTVVCGDATSMEFAGGVFDGVLAMTMLHHVPSPDAQDRLLGEAFRVLKPGGVFLGMDSIPDLRFRLSHAFDTMVPVDPQSFPERLAKAGFQEIAVRPGKGAFRWRARRPV